MKKIVKPSLGIEKTLTVLSLGLTALIMTGTTLVAQPEPSTPSVIPSIDQRVRGFDQPTLAGPGIDAAGKSIQVGHMALQFQSGRLVPIETGDRVSGLFFAGVGTFLYTSEDPYEAPFLAENVSEGSSYDVSGSSVSDLFSTAVLYTSVAPESLLEDVVWPQGAADGPTTERFARHREDRAEDWFVDADTLVVQAAIEAQALPTVFVELEGSKEDVVWTFDPLYEGMESFVVLEKTDSDIDIFKKRRYPKLLSSQAIGRDRLEPPPTRFDVTNLDVTVLNPSGRDAKISIEETVQARTPLKTLALQLDTTVTGTVSANVVFQELDYRLLSLVDGSGKPLAYSHRHDDLVIELNKPLKAGESMVLKLELEGDILYRPNNDNYWRLTSAWYPQPVYWEMERFSYHAVVKVAKPFKSFSSGQLVRRWQEGDLECAEFEELRPIARPGMMAGKYSTVTQKSGHRTVHVSSYAAKQPRSAKTLAKLALGFMEFFEPLLGEYPFDEVNIVEINSLGFGQAPAGIIYITREAFEPATDQSTRLYSEGINARIAHEVAHAWWGHVARLATPEDQWISESLADYYGAVAMGELKSQSEFDTALSFWQRGAKDAGGSGTVYMANYVTGDKAARQRYRLLYEKGPVVLHALRQELGDDAFFTIFKSFLRSFPWQPGRTKDVIGISSFVSKRDLRPWFDRYLFGTEIPEIKK
ncbi:MAG: hypothetical protein K8J08_17895 [Thermoanaerobaculia bacterium]|nr:hypothetical protein [Thermoanaerobaculia bacterium]